MKNLYFYFVVALLIAIGIASQGCEKDKGNSERFKLLTAHAWKYDTIMTICQDPEIIWFINLVDSASRGSTVNLAADGSFVSLFEEGKWKFSNGETEIITFDADDPTDILGHVRIDVLTDLVLEITDLVDVTPSDTCFVKSRMVK